MLMKSDNNGKGRVQKLMKPLGRYLSCWRSANWEQADYWKNAINHRNFQPGPEV
jgi:hypothetical protein